MPRRWFIHYYENGQFTYTESQGNRIANEARMTYNSDGTPFYDQVLTYRKKDLGDSFIQKHQAHFQHLRGAGYWIWKPRIVQLTLEKMEEGDELLYADTGSELKGNPSQTFSLLQEQELLPFYQSYQEKQWTKMDLAVKLSASQSDLDTIQPHATFFLLKKTPSVVRFIDHWLELCSQLHLIDDSPSFIPNDPTFREHRHDQSIWSLLIKKRGYRVYPSPSSILGSRLNSYSNHSK